MTTLILPKGFTSRAAREGDQQAVAELLLVHERHFYGDALASVRIHIGDLNAAWYAEHLELAQDSLLVFAPSGQLAGYVLIYHTPEEPQRLTASPLIHPASLGRGLGMSLNAWAQQRAGELITARPNDQRAVLQSWCKQLDSAAHHLLTQQGFVPERYFRTLQIDLLQMFSPPLRPEGINVRSFLRGQDERGAYETSAEAFATNEDASENLSFEEWCRWSIDTPDFDPSLAFLAVQQDRIIGIAFGWLITGDSGTIGWITDVAVRPAYRGQGIAQALLQQMFATCKHRGAYLCALAVDTENPSGATHLYERVGMRESVRCDVRYQKVLREPV